MPGVAQDPETGSANPILTPATVPNARPVRTASRAEPKPVQPGGPPVLLGGLAAGALARAGRIADGWISSSRADLTTIGDSIMAVTSAAVAAGRDPRALRFICHGVVKVRPAGEGHETPLTGPISKIKADIEALGDQGVTDLFVDLNFDPQVGAPGADAAESMARAEEALQGLSP